MLRTLVLTPTVDLPRRFAISTKWQVFFFFLKKAKWQVAPECCLNPLALLSCVPLPASGREWAWKRTHSPIEFSPRHLQQPW